MAKQYAAIITSKGQALIAAAIKGGTTVNITEIAVGDGNGSTPVPTVGQTALVNETARININSLTVDAGNANHVIADGVIPAETGGFWLREVGLFTDDGILLAVSALPPTYKPSAEEGATNSQRILITLIVSDTSAVNITVDNTTVMASESYVDDKIAVHEKSRNHPDGTLKAKGFVQLSSSVSSTSEVLAATPKAVKTANDNANTRVPSIRKVNSKELSADITLAAADVGAVSNILANVDNAIVKKIYDPSIVTLTGGVTLAGFFDDHPLGATFQAADTLMTYRRWYNAGATLTQYLHCTTGTIYVRVGAVSATEASGWQWRQTDGVLPFGWRKIYDTANPPTAADVDAVPSAGGNVGYLDNSTHYHIKAGAWDGAGGFAQQYSNPIAPFLIPLGYMASQDVSSYAPIIKGVVQTKTYGYGTAISFGALTAGDSTFAHACIHAIGDNGVQAAWQFDPNNGSFYSPGAIITPGNINCNGLENSFVNTGRLFVNSQPNPGAGQGTHLGWNETGSQGESDFVNNRGGGSGGFHFRIVNADNTVETGNVLISGTGDLTTTGNLNTGAAGGVYDQGQRVYSPNNRQPVNANTAGLSGNGWWRCADTGLIIQWGSYNYGARGWYGVNFPIAFPGGCMSVQVTCIDGGGVLNDNYATAQITSTSSFTGGQDNGGSYWMAIGW